MAENRVLLAGIHANGDTLTRRLHELREAASAASATVNASISQMMKNTNGERSSSPSGGSSKGASRASRRREREGDLLRDPMFNEDVSKLCSLTKLLTEENQRLDSLNCRYEEEVSQLKSSTAGIQQRLDETTKRMEALARENEKLRKRDYQKTGQWFQDSSGDWSTSLAPKQDRIVELVRRQAWGMLKGVDAQQQKWAKSEVERLAVNFVQGLIHVEDELVNKKAAILSSKPEQQEPPDQQQQPPESQSEVKEEETSSKPPQVLSYVLPAAALSGSLAAIINSMRVSSTAAAAASDQRFL